MVTPGPVRALPAACLSTLLPVDSSSGWHRSSALDWPGGLSRRPQLAAALAGILFSRKVAKVIEVNSETQGADHRIYRVRGQLFFVSSIYFRHGFELHEHPARVTINMGEAHIWDQSGVTALDQVIRKLKPGGSDVKVINLNQESTNLFARIGVAEEAGGRGGELSSAH
jgi:sulfate permease, SulP family